MADSKVRKWYVGFLYIAAVPLALVCSLMLWWMIFPQQIITYSDGYEIRTTEHSYVSGDLVVVTSDGEYCNNGAEVRVERRLENPYGGIVLQPVFFFPPTSPTCIDDNTFVFTIPDDIPPGKWKLTIVSTYRANPVRVVETSRSTNLFEVNIPHDQNNQ